MDTYFSVIKLKVKFGKFLIIFAVSKFAALLNRVRFQPTYSLSGKVQALLLDKICKFKKFKTTTIA